MWLIMLHGKPFGIYYILSEAKTAKASLGEEQYFAEIVFVEINKYA